MEQLPLVFDQSEVEPDIQECFKPAYNYTRINSSNGRLAFTTGKVYWLPDNPMAMIDQGWVINTSEIDSYAKYGVSGFTITLKDGKELRFSNVGSKMREGISAAIEEHKADPVAEAAPEEAAPKEAAPKDAAPEDAPAAESTAAEPSVAAPAAPEIDPEDVSSNKLMGILAYLGIFVFIPLLAAKNSKFARFHVNQGLILLICSVVSWFVGRLSPTVAWVLNAVIFVLAIIGIVNVVKGVTKKLPLIGNIRIIQ